MEIQEILMTPAYENKCELDNGDYIFSPLELATLTTVVLVLNFPRKESSESCTAPGYTADPVLGCYRLYINEPKSNTDARQQCANDGGRLLLLNSEAEYDRVKSLIGDKQCSGDVKAIEKGRNLVENRRIQAVSFMLMAMKFSCLVSYTFKLKLDKVTGDILNSHCECPAGRGPHSTCKHVAAVALMLSKFVQEIRCTWTSHVLKTSRSFINHVTVTMVSMVVSN
uniref:Uncharacterized protein n=1 Tax=Magallana gigas TaxID=29159 RepID=K1QVT9_MAGGI